MTPLIVAVALVASVALLLLLGRTGESKDEFAGILLVFLLLIQVIILS
ncbi:MAG: hypothetical protein M1433_01255 [Candidatus Parvarchaeota archaeon]|nr:hypothetical protein [Candidatus Parvarchaeota archaeon]